jgi:hypothetical protein
MAIAQDFPKFPIPQKSSQLLGVVETGSRATSGPQITSTTFDQANDLVPLRNESFSILLSDLKPNLASPLAMEIRSASRVIGAERKMHTKRLIGLVFDLSMPGLVPR